MSATFVARARARALLVTVGVTAGLVALAPSAGAVLATQVAIKPGSKTVRYATPLTWHGRLTGPLGALKNTPLVLEDRFSCCSGWRAVRTVRTDSNGDVTVPERRLTRTAQWRFVFRGGLIYDPSSSAVVTIRVLPPPRPKPRHRAVETFGQRVVNEAARHAGAPYEYGAAGPYAFDCSGFTMYVFGEFGYSLPHNAQEQYDVVHHVPQSDIQLGDLVFFYDSSGYVGHVGIYAGNGEIWHANHSGGSVVLESIWTSAYWVGRVQG